MRFGNIEIGDDINFSIQEKKTLPTHCGVAGDDIVSSLVCGYEFYAGDGTPKVHYPTYGFCLTTTLFDGSRSAIKESESPCGDRQFAFLFEDGKSGYESEMLVAALRQFCDFVEREKENHINWYH